MSYLFYYKLTCVIGLYLNYFSSIILTSLFYSISLLSCWFLFKHFFLLFWQTSLLRLMLWWHIVSPPGVGLAICDPLGKVCSGLEVVQGDLWDPTPLKVHSTPPPLHPDPTTCLWSAVIIPSSSWETPFWQISDRHLIWQAIQTVEPHYNKPWYNN